METIKYLKAIPFILLICFTNACFSQTIYKVSNIDSVLKVKANSVVRLKKHTIDIHAENSMTINRKLVITVLNRKGEDAINLSAYDAPERKIEKLEAIIYDPNGLKIHKIKRQEFKALSTSGGLTVATDNTQLSAQYKSGKFPYTVEFNSQITTSNTGFIPYFNFLSRYNQSVEKSTIIINNPTEIPIRSLKNDWALYNIKEHSNTTREIHYSASNIKAIVYESGAPSFLKLSPFIKFSLDHFTLINKTGTAKNWAEMGKWQYENLLRGRGILPESTINEINKLTANAKTDLEKSKLIYQYVQNKTRYISIQLGIGGWQPITASKVDQNGYGDCKALTNYTKALLDSQNIPNNYCVVYSGNKKIDFPENFSALMGNHVFLNLPQKTGEDIWLECTSQTNPFGFIGGFTDDRNVLVITPEKGYIKRTKKYTASDNLNTLTVKARFNGVNNTLEGSFQNQFEGMALRTCTGIVNSKNKVLKLQSIFSHLNNFTPKNIKTQSGYENSIGEVSAAFKIDNFAIKAGPRYIIKPNIFNTISPLKNTSKRRLPYVVDRGKTENATYTIDLSDQYTHKSLPNNFSINNDYGSYQIEYESLNQGNFIKMTRKLQLHEITITPEKYTDYVDFINQVAENDSKKIILKKIN